MSDGTAADVQIHPTKTASKRRKTVKTNIANGAIRKERPPAKIFMPFRACLSNPSFVELPLYANNPLLRL